MDKGIARSLVYQLLINDFPTDVSRKYQRGAFKDRQMQTRVYEDVTEEQILSASVA